MVPLGGKKNQSSDKLCIINKLFFLLFSQKRPNLVPCGFFFFFLIKSLGYSESSKLLLIEGARDLGNQKLSLFLILEF